MSRPSVQVTQVVEQNQSLVLEILIQSKLDTIIPKYREGDPERGFLEKLKASLGVVKDVGQFISILLKLAKEFGFSMDHVINIFS